MLVLVVLTFKFLDQAMSYLISTNASPVMMGSLLFGALVGIAAVVKAFAKPMGKVVDIVGLRKVPRARVASKDSAQREVS